MGIFDKAQEMAGQHPDQVNQGIDKAGDAFDEKTGGKFAQGTDKAQDAAKQHFGAQGGEPGQPQPDQAPAQDPTDPADQVQDAPEGQAPEVPGQ